MQNGTNTHQIAHSFEQILGLDIDENACQATRLSLALLHLVLAGRLPEHELNITAANAITYLKIAQKNTKSILMR